MAITIHPEDIQAICANCGNDIVSGPNHNSISGYKWFHHNCSVLCTYSGPASKDNIATPIEVSTEMVEWW